MLGNAWEWCCNALSERAGLTPPYTATPDRDVLSWDLYDSEVYGSYRVLRGGGWYDEHWSCRASVRRRSHPTFQIDDVGFRVAR